MMWRLSTKDTHEREDDEAERLVKPSPKVKPPRKDLRRQTTDADRDSDTSGDPDLKGDPDMSLNYKNVGGSLRDRVARRFLLADLARDTQYVYVVDQEEKDERKQRKTISEKTLKENPTRYKVVEKSEEAPPPRARKKREKQPAEVAPGAPGQPATPEGAPPKGRRKKEPVAPGQPEAAPTTGQPAGTPEGAPPKGRKKKKKLPPAWKEIFGPGNDAVILDYIGNLNTVDDAGNIYDAESRTHVPLPQASKKTIEAVVERFLKQQRSEDLKSVLQTQKENKAFHDILRDFAFVGGATKKEGEKEGPLAKRLRDLQSEGDPLEAMTIQRHIPELKGVPFPDSIRTLQDLVDAATEYRKSLTKEEDARTKEEQEAKEAEEEAQRKADEEAEEAQRKADEAEEEAKKAEQEKRIKTFADQLTSYADADEKPVAFTNFILGLKSGDFVIGKNGNTPVFLDPRTKTKRPFADLAPEQQLEIIDQFEKTQKVQNYKEAVKGPEKAALRKVLQEVRALADPKNLTGSSPKDSLLVSRIKALHESEGLDNVLIGKVLPAEIVEQLPDSITTVADFLEMSGITAIGKPPPEEYTPEEVEGLKKRAIARFEPEEAELILQLPPEDQNATMNWADKWRSAVAKDVQAFTDKLGEDFDLESDVDAMEPPEEVMMGDEWVILDRLPEEEQEVAFQRHKNAIRGLQVLARSLATYDLATKGIPKELTTSLVYRPDRAPRDVFEDSALDPVRKKLPDKKAIQKVFANLDPKLHSQVTAYYQAKDFNEVREKYLRSDSPLIDETMPEKTIIEQLKKATSELDDREKLYPSGTTFPVAQALRSKVLTHLRAMLPVDSEKLKKVETAIQEMDADDYDKRKAEWDKREKEREKADLKREKEKRKKLEAIAEGGMSVFETPESMEAEEKRQLDLAEQARKRDPEPFKPEGYDEIRKPAKKTKVFDALRSKLPGWLGGTRTASVVDRYLSSCSAMELMSMPTHNDRQAVYWGVDPYPKGHEGFAPYNEWEQAHVRDLTDKDFNALLKAAREWLRQPILDLATMGEGVPDARYRAALDFALQTLDGGRYSVALHPDLYNELLARLAGQPTNQTLLTIRQAQQRNTMPASQMIRQYASRLATVEPKLAFELMALADQAAQQEQTQQKQAAAIEEGYDQATGKFTEGGVMYFELTMEDYNMEEDFSSAEDGDEEAIQRLTAAGLTHLKPLGQQDRALVDLEWKALKEVERLFPGFRVGNEGHDTAGDLICKFNVNTYADVKKVQSIIDRSAGGGDDEIYLDTPYAAVRGFHLYPDANLANGRAWGVRPGPVEGDLSDWLEDFKPGLDKFASLRSAIIKAAKADPKAKQALLPVLRGMAR